MADKPDWKAQVKTILDDTFDDPIQMFATVADGRRKSNAVSCKYSNYGVMLVEDWIWRVENIRSQVSDELLVFWGHRTYEDDVEVRELVVTPGDSQFDIIRFMETTGNDTDLSTDDIVTKLMDLHDRYTINIFRANYDDVGFEVKTVPDDLTAFAEEMYKFCPDCVDQGAGSIEELVETYEKTIDYFDTLAVFLWWD